MRNLTFLLALSLSLFACGQQEKAENPFGRTADKSTDPQMSEKEFKADCERKKGYLRSGDTVCYHVPHKFSLTEDLQKELDLAGSLNILIGTVTQGAMLWGDVDGGQRIYFDLNGNAYASMAEGPLSKTPLNAGRLTIRIEAGKYNYVNAFVAECFNRAGSTACPPN